MWEMIVLGIIQGITEWLPISSDGMIFLAKNNFFGGADLDETLKLALFLHLGTFLAALLYFFKDVRHILNSTINYRSADKEQRKLVEFLFISTIVSGIIGLILYLVMRNIEIENVYATAAINLVVGLVLIITGILQLNNNKQGIRTIKDIKVKDSVNSGVVQGLAVIPGLSRSGSTVAVLLLSKFDDVIALKLSFLMSLPIVLIGNIILNWDAFTFSDWKLLGIFSAFITGLLTIHFFLKLAQKINFGKFVIAFAILVIFAALEPFIF